MEQLPATPPNAPKPPPASSTSSSNFGTSNVRPPPSSSLPPRPPPSQVSSRKQQPPIVPALPPMMLSTRRGKYPPQGIGRGHSSLPPKPGFPGKPLPRDTEAIVLTPGQGVDGPQFVSKPKRAYASVAAETPMRPMDPAVTNLTPMNRVSPSATYSNHPSTMPKTITPPAETARVAQYDPASARSPSAAADKQMASNKQQGYPRVNHGSPENGTSQEQFPALPAVMNQMAEMSLQSTYGRKQQAHEQQNMNGFVQNGGPLHEMFPMHNGHFNHGMPPPHMPHHPTHLQHHHPHQPTFFPPPYTGTLTPPPNSVFMGPPPVPPHMVEMYHDGSNGVDGTITHPQSPFSPVYPYPPPPPGENFTNHMPGFASPPPQQFDGHREQPVQSPQANVATPMNGSPSAAMVAQRNAAPAGSTRLRNISFGSPDEEGGSIQGAQQTPVEVQQNEQETHAQEARNGVDHENGATHLSMNFSTHPVHSYTLDQFLSKRLADVSIEIAFKGLPETSTHTSFPAHSFVLGRSPKFYELIGQAVKQGRLSPLSQVPSRTSWADEVEDDGDVDLPASIKARLSHDNITVITLDSDNQYLSKKSFLAALKWLYGGSNEELIGFIEPTSLPNSVESDTTHQTSNQESLASINGDHRSFEVEHLERSIELFIAGCLLGLDEVIFRAMDYIRKWGLTPHGGAFERLLKFLFEEAEEIKKDEALSSNIPGSFGAKLDFIDMLLNDAIAFFVRNIPPGFKLDSRAPPSKHLIRLPRNASQPSTGSTTPLQSLGSQQKNLARQFRQTYSTVFLSLPFSALKTVLEHPMLAFEGTKKARFELASSIVQERERRRKRDLKSAQEVISPTSDGTSASQPEARPRSESAGSSFVMVGKQDVDMECLFWEESVVSTFGHGGIGIEVTHRRKGGPGGRMLWKVGRGTSA